MDLIGMNCCLMKQYIEFVADRLLSDLGLDKVTLFKLKANVSNWETHGIYSSKPIYQVKPEELWF